MMIMAVLVLQAMACLVQLFITSVSSFFRDVSVVEQVTLCIFADSEAPMLTSCSMYDLDPLDALNVIEQAVVDDGLTPAEVGEWGAS